MEPQQFPISIMYKKENGMYVVDLKPIVFPEHYTFSEQVAIVMPPAVIAGNHKHKRAEAFIVLGTSVDLYWENEKLEVKKMQMVTKEQLYVTIVPSNVPHAIKNNNTEHSAFLIEYGTEQPGPVERVALV